MVMTSLGKVLIAHEAGSTKLSELRAAAIQIVLRTPKMFWITKPLIIRNVPITAVRPTPRLAEWRLKFAELASNWRGKTGTDTLEYDSRSKKHKAGDIVLAVQAAAQKTLKGRDVELTKPRAKTYDEKDKKYRSYIRYARHTKEELKKLAGIK
jgi:hypothetical protein